MEQRRAESLDATWRTCATVCAAIAAVVPTLLAVALVVDVRPPAVESGMRTLLVAFAGISLAATLASLTAGRLVREGSIRAAQRRMRQAGHAFSRADALLGVMLTSSIVPYALAEVPLLVGFSYYMMGGSRSALFGFAGLTLLGYAVSFPRKSAWRDLLDQAEALDAGYSPIVS